MMGVSPSGPVPLSTGGGAGGTSRRDPRPRPRPPSWRWRLRTRSNPSTRIARSVGIASVHGYAAALSPPARPWWTAVSLGFPGGRVASSPAFAASVPCCSLLDAEDESLTPRSLKMDPAEEPFSDGFAAACERSLRPDRRKASGLQLPFDVRQLSVASATFTGL